MKTTIELPLLPLRDVVVYPHMVIPLFVGREKSIEALEAAMTGDKQILLLAQRNPADDDPGGARQLIHGEEGSSTPSGDAARRLAQSCQRLPTKSSGSRMSSARCIKASPEDRRGGAAVRCPGLSPS